MYNLRIFKKGCKSYIFFSPLGLPSDPAGRDRGDGWGEDFKKGGLYFL